MGRATTSEELAFIVERNRATKETADQIKAAVKQMSDENAMMEDVLKDKHRMLTNSDLALIVGSVTTRKDGTANSAILAARKPPILRSKSRALAAVLHGSPTRAADMDAPRLVTGKPNFTVLTQQQRESLDKTAESRLAYDRMLTDFVKKQQSLSERFAGIL